MLYARFYAGLSCIKNCLNNALREKLDNFVRAITVHDIWAPSFRHPRLGITVQAMAFQALAFQTLGLLQLAAAASQETVYMTYQQQFNLYTDPPATHMGFDLLIG